MSDNNLILFSLYIWILLEAQSLKKMLMWILVILLEYF
jgi:hypothetical protein